MPCWHSTISSMPSGSSAFWVSALHGMDSHSIPTRRASSVALPSFLQITCRLGFDLRNVRPSRTSAKRTAPQRSGNTRRCTRDDAAGRSGELAGEPGRPSQPVEENAGAVAAYRAALEEMTRDRRQASVAACPPSPGFLKRNTLWPRACGRENCAPYAPHSAQSRSSFSPSHIRSPLPSSSDDCDPVKLRFP
jgi:hypothetical protein